MTVLSDMLKALQEASSQPASFVHLQSQRKNAYTELATQALSQISPIAIIPGKTAQLLNSASTFFNPSIHIKEKAVQGLQALLSATQIGLSLLMIMKGKSSCDDLATVSCRLMLASQLLYNGVLLTGWIPGEQHDRVQSPLKAQ